MCLVRRMPMLKTWMTERNLQQKEHKDAGANMD